MGAGIPCGPRGSGRSFAGGSAPPPVRSGPHEKAVRLLHASDRHLGRSLPNLSLLEDHAAILAQIVEIARDRKPHAVLIAGDLNDRAVPPPEAVELLDDVLSRLILDLTLYVIVPAGNHDSRERFGFAARLLERNRPHITAADSPARIVPVEDGHGPVEILALSCLDPAKVREYRAPNELHDHDAALRAPAAPAHAGFRASRTVLATHAFVEGGSASDCERPLSVGGTGLVSPACFDGFDFVALAGLHRPQSVSQECLHYSGAVLRFSFPELGRQKSVSLVGMNARDELDLNRIPLLPLREMHCLEGLFDDLPRAAPPGVRLDDLISTTLLDKQPVLGAMNRLRARYPNLLRLSQPALVKTPTGGVRSPERARVSDQELFADFFRQVTVRPLERAGNVREPAQREFTQAGEAFSQDLQAAREALAACDAQGRTLGAAVPETLRTSKALAKAIEAARTKPHELNAAWEAAQCRKRQTAADLAAAQTARDMAVHRADDACAALEQLAGRLDDALCAAHFLAPEDCHSGRLTQEETAGRKRRIQDFRDQPTAATARLQQARHTVAGL